MNPDFHENIGSAYNALEHRLQKDRADAIGFLDARPHKKRDYEPMFNSIIFVNPPEGHLPIDPRKHLAGRVPVNLGNGYLAKFVPAEDLSNVFFYHLAGDCPDNRFEEDSVRVLRDYGFTEENGFFVPEHKVVGVSIVDGVPKVDEKRYGWVIVEDVSEGGLYEVTDVMPHHFEMLDNGREFGVAYGRNLRKLLELYNDPTIAPSVYRHGTPKNPVQTLSKMLLTKVRDNKGEIVVGDLNNVRFDRK
ncbi:hypothetical protein ACFL0X_02805 [Nanoarchaeota archaeon]